MKKMSGDILNTDGFQRSVLARVLCTKLEEMAEAELSEDMLLRPQILDELAEMCLSGKNRVFVSNTAKIAGTTIWAGDALLMGDSLYGIAGFCAMQGHVHIAATCWGCVGPVGSKSRWKVEADIHLVDMTDRHFHMFAAKYNEAEGNLPMNKSQRLTHR